MAANDAVWGIDIGQSALKALRLRPSQDDKTKVVADAFDFVEYPTIIGQPDADAAELVREALKTFLSRNSVKDDKVAISVSGQNGLARFIKLPPVEAKKIPDIVRYEARQQIPFKLEDVVWDYQKMPGGSEEEGFALEAEVGLFAMKRDQVFRSLRPLEDVGIEVDFIQLTPLAIFNAVAFDQLQEGDAPPPYDPENPPKSTAILSIGTDTSDLVVTNGYRVWQRSIPIGGNHFTKALTKQLKLTFGKAEHMKRNANAAKPEDAKALFKAMRPVFGDLLTEVQTSIRYFRMNVDKDANIKQVVALGNAMKLPGLRRYLEQNLDLTVTQLDAYRRMTGSGVVTAPAFKENLLSYSVCYGLALQGLGRSVLRTNLIPQEIHTQRMIDEKKPWALAAAAALLLGFSISYFGHWIPWWQASDSGYKDAETKVTAIKTRADGITTKHNALVAENAEKVAMVERLLTNVDGRLVWPELVKAVNMSLPVPSKEASDKHPANSTANNSTREDLFVTSFNSQPFTNVSQWFTGPVKTEWNRTHGGTGADAAETATEAPAADSSGDSSGDSGGEPAPEGGEATGETKPGFVIELKGHHYRNNNPADAGGVYVQQTLIKNLEEGFVDLPGKDGKVEKVAIKDLGVQYPVLVFSSDLRDVPNPAHDPTDPMNQQPARLRRFDFIVQFWWTETPRIAREKAKLEAQAKPAEESGDTTDAAAG